MSGYMYMNCISNLVARVSPLSLPGSRRGETLGTRLLSILGWTGNENVLFQKKNPYPSLFFYLLLFCFFFLFFFFGGGAFFYCFIVVFYCLFGQLVFVFIALPSILLNSRQVKIIIIIIILFLFMNTMNRRYQRLSLSRVSPFLNQSN